jgi:hypothetical protein
MMLIHYHVMLWHQYHVMLWDHVMLWYHYHVMLWHQYHVMLWYHYHVMLWHQCHMLQYRCDDAVVQMKTKKTQLAPCSSINSFMSAHRFDGFCSCVIVLPLLPSPVITAVNARE